MQTDPGLSEGIGNRTLEGKAIGISPRPQAQTQPEGKGQPAQDSDAKSDSSYDPLFDDDPDGVGDGGDEKPPVTTESTQGASNVVQTPEPPRPAVSSIAPPKNAPPLLDPTSFATYSSNVLMTAYIDGQVVLWDRRVQTPGRGVGRLWMSEKTPPWCLSVSLRAYLVPLVCLTYVERHVGPQMATSSMLDVAMGRLMSGMSVNSDIRAP